MIETMKNGWLYKTVFVPPQPIIAPSIPRQRSGASEKCRKEACDAIWKGQKDFFAFFNTDS